MKLTVSPPSLRNLWKIEEDDSKEVEEVIKFIMYESSKKPWKKKQLRVDKS